MRLAPGLIPVPCAFVLVVGLGSALEAAEAPRYGRIHLGPVHLTPRLSVTAGVDNNVYNSEDRAVSDEIVTVTPSLEVVVPLTRHARFRTSGGVSPHFFAKEEVERHTDRFGSVGAEVDLGPLSASVSRGRGRFRQRFSLEIDDRLLREEERRSIGVALHMRRISFGATERVLTTTFDDAIGATLDRESTTRRFELRVPITRRTTVVPSMDLVEDRFLRSVAPLPPTVESTRYRLALEFSEVAFLRGRVAAGLRRTEGGQGVAPFEGAILEVDLLMPFFLGTRLALEASRDTTYAVIPAVDGSQRNTAVTGMYRSELRFELPFELHGRASTTYTTLSYLSPTIFDEGSSGGVERGISSGATLLRRFGDHVSVGGTALRNRRRSPRDGRSYVGWSYGVTGEVRF